MKWTSDKKPPDSSKITEVDISDKNLTKIPNWISNCNNLIKLYCSYNKIIQIPDTLPNSLQRFNCYNNKITQIPNILPDSLEYFDCGHNQITQIPDTLPDSLQVFECCFNQITQIPDTLPNSLQEFWCGCNQITQIPDTLPDYLQKFFCSNNKITQIPNTLPSSLKKFYCYDNKITQIPDTLPNSLKKFLFGKNKITQIPVSIINLRNLKIIGYEENTIDYIPHIVSRFLNNLRNITTITVYNDSQSVHNHNIQECIKKSIYNILQDKYDDNYQLTINQILDDNILDEISKNALVEYSNTTDIHSVLNITFKDLLTPIWQRIQKHIHKDEIKKILNIEIKDGLCMCFTGRISRLVNCLNGFYSDVVINIGTNEQIGNIVVMIGKKLKSDGVYTEELHRQLVCKQLKEMNYEEQIINEWLEFI